MRGVSVELVVVVVLLLLHPLSSSGLEEEEDFPVEVVVNSSSCSSTCGLGLKTQTLCLLKDSWSAMEEDAGRKDGSEVSEVCRVRMVKCVESWQCGLRTMTVTVGDRLEIDCLGEVMEAMGRFSWRVLWRYAPGIISSDNSLFARWRAPKLDHVVLEPIREEDAGTYRCDVQDPNFRRVKRVYWGIRVLPAGFLNLDYDHGLSQWESTGNQQNQTESEQDHQRMVLLCTVLAPPIMAGAVSGVILSVCWSLSRRRLRCLDRRVYVDITV